MLRLGWKHADNILSRHGITLSLSGGEIIFEGSGILGNGSCLMTINGGKITFGKNFGITGNFTLGAETSITIGDNFSSSWDVRIFDTDFHDCLDLDTNQSVLKTIPIILGENCWICQGCMILKGSRIPAWSIVGAGSIVNKDFSGMPQHTLFIGQPVTPKEKRIQRTDLANYIQDDGWTIA